MKNVEFWIETEGIGNLFFWAFPICILLLFVCFKKRRVLFLIPCLIICLIILNPFFYKMWDELGLYAYWRILWVVPVIPVLAATMPCICERIERKWIKTILTCAAVGLVILGGTYLYNGNSGAFVEAVNVAKLPGEVVDIAEKLLEIDLHPRAIIESNISTYIRQYTGKIDLLYGRDIYGYILYPSAQARKINDAINIGDMEQVGQTMADEGYDYLVYNNNVNDKFEIIDVVGGYGIYKTVCVPQIKKLRNELGEVVSITTLNEKGQAINNNQGYSTVIYDYDDRKNIIYEIHKNVLGEAVVDATGKVGFERVFDSSDRIIIHKNLAEGGNLVLTDLGYAEYRRNYKGDKLASESFYDETGKLVKQINGYAIEENEYNKNGYLISRSFLDCERELTISSLGYAKKKCIYDDNDRLIKVEYYDTERELLYQPAGFVAYEQIWNNDYLKSRIYLDNNNRQKDRIDGYSQVAWIIDENGVTNIHFYDINGYEIPISGLNLVKDIEIGIDGWSEWMTPEPNTMNYCYTIGTANLGEKSIGDKYTCQIEIEFMNVTSIDNNAFAFATQGRGDFSWNNGNIWNSGFVWVGAPPQNGIYKFEKTITINEKLLDVSNFELGFRCDNWNTGSFRVRNVKIEKGNIASAWSPGL